MERQLNSRAVVIGSGTFLRGLMHTGEKKTEGGRVGEMAAATGLSGCLARLGLELGRLKTGTPPRLSAKSIDFSVFEPQPGDEQPAPFSYLNEYAGNWRPPLRQMDCFLSSTNEQIHELIRANLHRAPMYSGQIAGTGPRYCPSLEDKVVRFAERKSHHIFLEPEGLETDEIYCNGISTSLPADVQEQIIPLVPGLKNAVILRFGYAVEYDMVWPTQIRSTLETKSIGGLFLAGQINGTSGYEEAAAQGLVAGVNAVRYVKNGQPDFVLRRDQAYIGVLIDDLVTKPPIEPYRMFTSRAEHRLHLRNDNADERLATIGREIGLVTDDRWDQFQSRRQSISQGQSLLGDLRAGEMKALDYLRRSEVTWGDMLIKSSRRRAAIDPAIGWQIEIRAKYKGYITRQDKQIERFAHDGRKANPNELRLRARHRPAQRGPPEAGKVHATQPGPGAKNQRHHPGRCHRAGNSSGSKEPDWREILRIPKARIPGETKFESNPNDVKSLLRVTSGLVIRSSELIPFRVGFRFSFDAAIVFEWCHRATISSVVEFSATRLTC